MRYVVSQTYRQTECVKDSGHSSNNELWLISYADLMTLLFGFFFLLYVGQEEGFKSISDSLAAEFGTPAQKSTAPVNSPLAEEISKSRLFLFPCRLCIGWIETRYSPVAISVDIANGLIVEDIVAEGPADIAGIKELDIITHIDGKPATNRLADGILYSAEPNRVLNFTISREGKRLSIPVQLDRFTDIQGLDTGTFPETEILLSLKGRPLNDIDRIRNYIPRYVPGWIITKSDTRKILPGDILSDFKKRGETGSYLVKVYRRRDFRWILLP